MQEPRAQIGTKNLTILPEYVHWLAFNYSIIILLCRSLYSVRIHCHYIGLTGITLYARTKDTNGHKELINSITRAIVCALAGCQLQHNNIMPLVSHYIL